MEKRKSKNCINWCGSYVPFDEIYNGEKAIHFYTSNLDKPEKNKIQKNNVKGIGEEDLTIISALGSHNCVGRKSIVWF